MNEIITKIAKEIFMAVAMGTEDDLADVKRASVLALAKIGATPAEAEQIWNNSFELTKGIIGL